MAKLTNTSMANFRDEVIEKSMANPIVLIFWAEWSEECKQMMPVLESLSNEMNFIQVGVQSEDNPELISHFKIKSVPDIKIVHQGQIVGEIQEDFSEKNLKESLNRFFQSPMDNALSQILPILEDKNVELHILEGLVEPLNELCSKFPKDKKGQYYLAKILMRVGRQSEAEALLSSFSEGDEFYKQAKAILDLKIFSNALLEKSETELDETYQQACQLSLDGNYEESLTTFLKIVKKDREYKEDVGRTSMLVLFDILGKEDPLTIRYKQLLSMYLFS